MFVESEAYARAGLIGNPSDGYNGKTISIVIREFSAKVSLTESDAIEFIPNEQDKDKYASLEDFKSTLGTRGYYGAERLFKATISRFIQYCEINTIEMHNRNFTLRYSSTIPRRVGMAGSSALITATMRCLMAFYKVEIPNPLLADIIWRIENEELSIACGLQDRVIQVFEGCLFMDFNKDIIEKQGYGVYKEVDLDMLPNIFIAYRVGVTEGSEVFHNSIRERWLNGDQQVIDAMQSFAGFAQEAYDLIVEGSGDEIGPLMDQNFELRTTLYNLSPGDVSMVELARSVGAHCKFSGSGGAIVGTYEDDDMYEMLEHEFLNTDVVILKPTIKEDLNNQYY